MKYHPKEVTVDERPCGTRIVRLSGAFQGGIIRVENVWCRDGERRTAYITHQSYDTMSTIGARISVRRKSVTGFVQFKGEQVIEFVDSHSKKNGNVLQCAICGGNPIYGRIGNFYGHAFKVCDPCSGRLLTEASPIPGGSIFGVSLRYTKMWVEPAFVNMPWIDFLRAICHGS